MKRKIMLLGGNGYIGRAFEKKINARNVELIKLSRSQLDYSKFKLILQYILSQKPNFIINAAGFTGKPNVDACELNKADTLVGNVNLPQTIAQACEVAKIPWGHVSSGCIYSGAKIYKKGIEKVVKDLSTIELKEFAIKTPHLIRGFTEKDTPNFTFRDLPCSFYSGTKALAEETLGQFENGYLWRLRIPFDEFSCPRNYLTKIQSYEKVYDNINSLSHREDFVSACLDLWEINAPYGIYNVTNPGFVSTRQVVEMIRLLLSTKKRFEFWSSDKEFYQQAANTPRSNCVLDVSKIVSTGIKLCNVNEALERALNKWKSN